MQPTPHPEALAGTFSTIISASLLLLGVPPYTLVWGLIGAAFAMLLRTTEIGRLKAFALVLASAAIAAAAGVGYGEWAKSDSRPIITLVCIVTGFGCQSFLSAAVELGVGALKRLSGVKVEGK